MSTHRHHCFLNIEIYIGLDIGSLIKENVPLHRNRNYISFLIPLPLNYRKLTYEFRVERIHFLGGVITLLDFFLLAFISHRLPFFYLVPVFIVAFPPPNFLDSPSTPAHFLVISCFAFSFLLPSIFHSLSILSLFCVTHSLPLLIITILRLIRSMTLL